MENCKYFCQMSNVLGYLIQSCFLARVWQWEVLSIGVGQVSFSSYSTGNSSGKLSSIPCLLEKDIPTFILFPWDSTFNGACAAVKGHEFCVDN